MRWDEICFLLGGLMIVFGIIVAGCGWISMQQRSWDRLKHALEQSSTHPPLHPKGERE